MKTLTSITGKQTTVLSMNKRERTARIKTSSGTYVTNKQSNEDFQSMQKWTGNDWAQFLKTNDYYSI